MSPIAQHEIRFAVNVTTERKKSKLNPTQAPLHTVYGTHQTTTIRSHINYRPPEPIGGLISFDRDIIQPETITERIIANSGQPKTDPGDYPRVGKDFVGGDVLLVIFQVEE
jgi:hypothetical protein